MKTIKYKMQYVPLDEIYVDNRFDRDVENNLDIEVLAGNIKENGLHTEIWLNEESDGSLSLIAGYRRYKALLHLKETETRAKIYNVSRLDADYMVCGENTNRLNYDEFERISNFIYLVYKEHVSVDKNKDAARFVPVIIASAINNVIDNAMLKTADVKNASTQEKEFIIVIKKVLKKSNLFEDLGEIKRRLPLVNASLKIKKFAITHTLSMKSIIYLIRFEAFLDALDIDSFIENGDIVEYDKHRELKKVLADIKQLENKHNIPISDVLRINRERLNNVDASINTSYDTILGTAESSHSIARKILRDNTIAYKYKKRLIAQLNKFNGIVLTINENMKKTNKGKI